MKMTYSARCKDCKFLNKATVYKKNGEISKINRYKCTNYKSPRANSIASPRDLVCDKWELS